MRIKKGDTVQIMAGKDVSKQGKVLAVFPKSNKVLIEGLNLFKKHLRSKKQGEKGEMVTVSRPLSAANVLIFCSVCGRGVRVNKKRICKKCQAQL